MSSVSQVRRRSKSSMFKKVYRCSFHNPEIILPISHSVTSRSPQYEKHQTGRMNKHNKRLIKRIIFPSLFSYKMFSCFSCFRNKKLIFLFITLMCKRQECNVPYDTLRTNRVELTLGFVK